MNFNNVQELYRSSTAHVRGVFEGKSDEAARYYRRYVAFVLKNLTRPGARILDVGCGSGWSTWLLREESHDAHGTDLHAGPVLEHVPSPERALTECRRVLRAGGRLMVVGPHLLSVGVSARVVLKETLKAIRHGG